MKAPHVLFGEDHASLSSDVLNASSKTEGCNTTAKDSLWARTEKNSAAKCWASLQPTALSFLPPAAAQAHPFPSVWRCRAVSFETQHEVTVLDRMHFVLLEYQWDCYFFPPVPSLYWVNEKSQSLSSLSQNTESGHKGAWWVFSLLPGTF